MYKKKKTFVNCRWCSRYYTTCCCQRIVIVWIYWCAWCQTDYHRIDRRHAAKRWRRTHSACFLSSLYHSRCFSFLCRYCCLMCCCETCLILLRNNSSKIHSRLQSRWWFYSCWFIDRLCSKKKKKSTLFSYYIILFCGMNWLTSLN